MSKRTGWGQRRVKITPELWEALLVNDDGVVQTDLPDDARFVRQWPADTGNVYFMVFESPQWDELAEGEEIPILDVESRRVDTA